VTKRRCPALRVPACVAGRRHSPGTKNKEGLSRAPPLATPWWHSISTNPSHRSCLCECPIFYSIR